MSTPAQPPPAISKRDLRERLLTARRARPEAERAAVAEALAEHIFAWDVVRRSACVACYVSVGSEPGTRVLLERLRAAGKRVLLPVLQTDNDLDWGVFAGELAPAGRGLLEPTGPPLGVAAVAEADVLLVPGLAVSAEGDRLGRGGGSYDRAIARVGAEVPIGVLLHDEEFGLAVPVEAHDRRVTHAATPAGVTTLRRVG